MDKLIAKDEIHKFGRAFHFNALAVNKKGINKFILVPIILIVLVLIDIAKNVVAKSEDDMKKNKNLAIKRVVYAVDYHFQQHYKANA